jgi:hypothetical protein
MKLHTLVAVNFLALIGTADAQQTQNLPVDDKQFAAAVLRATDRWAETAPCSVTAEAKQAIGKAFEPLKSTLVATAARYGLDETATRRIIKSSTESYLDLVKMSGGFNGQVCKIEKGNVASIPVPQAVFRPDTGYLIIGGSKKGADIFLDGERKGQIQATFMLSVGNHNWKTMKCEEPVEIKPNETVSRYCGKN